MLDHVGDPRSTNQVRCSYHVELAQMDVYGQGCNKFALFSRGLMRGLVQVVEWLGHVGQTLEVAWLLVLPCLLNSGVLGDQACHICRKAWEGFHRQCLAKKCQFSHVSVESWPCLFRHTL